RRGPGGQYHVAAKGMGKALEDDRWLLGDVEHAADVAVRRVTDPKASRRRPLLHAGGDVDGDATDAALGIDTAAQQYRTGMDADAHVEDVAPVSSLDLEGKPTGLVQDPEPRAHGALGIVLARFDGAEDCQQAGPGVLEDPAALRLDDRREARERAVHDSLNVLGLEPPAQPRGLHHVREQDRHRLELLFGYVEAGESGPQRGERDLDDRVAQDGALGLQ